MQKKSKIIYLLISILFFILCDVFLTESIIKNGYLVGENPIFDITFAENLGAAFNILSGFKGFLITFSCLALTAIIFYTIKHIEKFSVFTLFFTSMLTAGIFTNMYERIVFGFVRDFIKLNFIDFPIFNLSDIFINIGVVSLIFIILKRSYQKRVNKN